MRRPLFALLRTVMAFLATFSLKWRAVGPKRKGLDGRFLAPAVLVPSLRSISLALGMGRP
ncbi:MAG: hypothetical protein OXH83_03745 [Bryobacterales bacterium]|nr:hypothetical protein [Bryobacterales bacterium]